MIDTEVRRLKAVLADVDPVDSSTPGMINIGFNKHEYVAKFAMAAPISYIYN